MEIESLVAIAQGYGYLGVLTLLIICGFGLPLPEDVTLVAGGIIAGLGHAELPGMIAVGLVGVMLGDGIVFTAGRLYGERILRLKYVARFMKPERLMAVQRYYARWGNWVLFFARFMPGLRTPVFLTAGISGVSFGRWFAFDGMAALLSVPAWVVLGYVGAHNRDWLKTWIARGQVGIFSLLGIIVLGIVTMIVVKKVFKAKLDAPATGTGAAGNSSRDSKRVVSGQ